MDPGKVIFRKEGHIATITLNRPEARNALSEGMVDGIAKALEDCMAQDVRAVIITGSGGSFCSGADVKDFTKALEQGPQGMPPYLKAKAGRLHRTVMLKISQLPKPVIASINGVAAGAGVGLALACDMRVASEDSRLFLAFASIGATIAGGASYYLPRIVGRGLAMEAYLMNQPISAQRALEMCLVNRVVPADRLEEITLEMAQTLASGPTAAYGRVKALIDQSWNADLACQLDEEADAFGDNAMTQDFQEGITAFVEKRRPKFQGK